MSQRTIYILKTGSTLPELALSRGDFEDWIASGLHSDLPVQVLDALQSSQPEHVWPRLEQMAGLVITGSHHMVTDGELWMESSARWLRQVVDAGLPVLGICFGHQLLAHALDGVVGANPHGLELGSVDIQVHAKAHSDPLWQCMPERFLAHAVHYQSVLRLPSGASLLAGNAHDPHHAFRWGRHAWGVQFHPEFDAPCMQAYRQHVQARLQAQELADGTGLIGHPVSATPDAAQLLSGFSRYVAELQPLTACLA